MKTWCCVPMCSNIGGHLFPKNAQLRAEWIKQIQRDGHKKWEPTSTSVVCKKHFLESDYVQTKKSGVAMTINKLKKDAVPSIFHWTKKKETDKQIDGCEENKEEETDNEKMESSEKSNNKLDNETGATNNTNNTNNTEETNNITKETSEANGHAEANENEDKTNENNIEKEVTSTEEAGEAEKEKNNEENEITST